MANINNLRAAGYTYSDLNKSRNNAYQKYYHHLRKAKAIKDPKKRAEAMVEVERLKQAYKAIHINTPTSTGMKDLLKKYKVSLNE